MASSVAVSISPEKRERVLAELARIIESRYFRNATRSTQFLRYVVEHALHNSEPLKERTIGVELFERHNDYATGDDAIVRVQAAEVRRRLEQYYRAITVEPGIRIEIPVGSYSPVFSEVQVQPSVEVERESPKPSLELRQSKRFPKYLWTAIGMAILVVIGVIEIGGYGSGRAVQNVTAIDEFWSPVFATPQPVLVCLAKSTVYRPTEALFQRYSRTHPGAFGTVVEKYDKSLAFNPNESISWGELLEDPAFGVARGDAYAAVTLSALLGRINKPGQVRIGSDYSFSDLKNSPSVIVGAFNNRFTLQVTSNLHFAFVEESGKTLIRERGGSGRVWEQRYRDNNRLDPMEDSAIVARLLDSGTGQFTIIVAGVGELGTQAASELVARSDLLEPLVRTLPSGWQKKDLEIVLQTAVTDSVPGPPHAVATYAW